VVLMAVYHELLPPPYHDEIAFFRVIGSRGSLDKETISAWLDDPARPGQWSWGQWWLAIEGNLSPRDCIEVFITDPDVAVEFKMRWC
jgi:hypothetical protein